MSASGAERWLAFEMRPPHPRSVTSDLIDLVVVDGGIRHVLMTVDGRYLSAESTGSFVGRVAGAYCETGHYALPASRSRTSDDPTNKPDCHSQNVQ